MKYESPKTRALRERLRDSEAKDAQTGSRIDTIRKDLAKYRQDELQIIYKIIHERIHGDD